MVVGNGLGFELAQHSLDLCGSEFHRTLLSMGSPQGDKPRCRDDDPYNDLGPSSHQSYPAYIINTRGYDFRE
jgi:hypothetical protein